MIATVTELGPVHTCLIEALLSQMRPVKARGELLVNPNKQQATLNGLIWGAALREMPFLHAATLFFADVHSAYCAQNALQPNKLAISLRPNTCEQALEAPFQ